MDEGRTYQRDVLEERGWIDRWGFLLFAFGGAAGILMAKVVGLAAVPVAAGAAVAMVAYAFVVQTSGTGRLRADQAGDNCYYLGLIYTLVSLSYAIFFFDPATTATTVVQGFGIALATTIMGLVLRVFFNQSRVDLVETEDTARIELAEAAGRLKAELQAITISMSDYGRETRQALEELRGQVAEALVGLRQGAAEAIGESSSTASPAIGAIAAEATAAVAQQSKDALARSRSMTTATDKVVASIERHAEAMGGIERSSTAIATSLTTLESATQRTQAGLGELAAKAAELAKAQADLGATGGDLSAAVSAMTEQVKAFDATATRFEASIASRLDEIRAVPGDMAKRTSETLDRAASAIERQFDAIAQGQQGLVDEVARGAEAGVAALHRHNAALERELERSRENVAKVHGALVDMTGMLVEQVRVAEA
jgi:hypothetical protein